LAAARDPKASRLDALLAEALIAAAERAAMSQTGSYDADSLQSDYGVCFAQGAGGLERGKSNPWNFARHDDRASPVSHPGNIGSMYPSLQNSTPAAPWSVGLPPQTAGKKNWKG